MDSVIVAAIITAAGSVISAIIGRLPDPKKGKGTTNENGNNINKLRSWFSGISFLLLFITIIILVVGFLRQNDSRTEETHPSTYSTLSPTETESETIFYKQTEAVVSAENEKEIPYVLPGSTKSLGHYEQDGNTLNGAEKIRWIVLTQKDDEVLLISEYGLDISKYYQGEGISDWANSRIRQLLNETFFKTAFTEEEQSYIIEKNNEQHPNINNPSCNQGEDTIDNVFLLSAVEYMEYVYNNGAINELQRCGTPSECIKEKVELKNEKYSWYWLRTSANDKNNVCCVTAYGKVDYGTHEIHELGMVRPAIWVKADLWNEPY